MVEWEMPHKYAKYLMCKSLKFAYFHNKAMQKFKFEKIHLMLIMLIWFFTVGIGILFIRIMKLKNNEILFFMLSPAIHPSVSVVSIYQVFLGKRCRPIKHLIFGI